MKLAFVVPCHGRHRIADACLRQLRRSCDMLADDGVEATAVVVANEQHFAVLASQLGFAYVEAANSPLGRKWNDGYEAAAALGVDVFVPFGSDDVIDPAFIVAGGAPATMTMRCATESTVVAADGLRMVSLKITYHGGDGVRLLPRDLLELLRFRPAEDERERAIDGSIMDRLWAVTGRRPAVSYFDLHPLQIVDFKSEPGYQLNSYEACKRGYGAGESDDPWGDLASVYPGEFLEEIAAVYGLRVAKAAA